MGEQANLHLYLQSPPITLPPELCPVRSAAALDSHRNANSTVNCPPEGSRLRALRENHPQTIPTFQGLWNKIVFHETSPWCPEGQGPLIYISQQHYKAGTLCTSIFQRRAPRLREVKLLAQGHLACEW